MLRKHKTAVLVSPIAEWIPDIPDADWIGIDVGCKKITEAGHECLLAIGDFDSGSLEADLPYPVWRLPVAKDETDSEMAMKAASEMGYATIYFLGAFGKRMDHTLANIRCIVWKYPQVIALEEKQRISLLLPGSYRFDGSWKHYSFFAYEESVITLEGFDYPLTRQPIDQKDMYTCSNSISDAGQETKAIVEKGRVLCVESNWT